MRKGKELGAIAFASTTTFRGCWCHPQSHRLGPVALRMRSQQNSSKQEERRYWTECTELCVAIWETGEWPEEWTFSTFIPLPKKGDLKQCANYRTIAFVFHASKMLLRIILKRIRVKTETEIADEQAGFRQGRGTRNQITNLRILMHKAREYPQPLCAL